VSLEWKRPRRAPTAAAEEMLEDVARRARARSEDRAAGWPDLLRERGHPLVRAALRSGRGRRQVLTAALVAVPLWAFAAALATAVQPETGELAGWAIGIFACLWPTVCFLGAGLAAGAAVIDERERGTALQLVLTPVGKRPIAAAKVLPAVRIFLPAAAAGLPACLLAGSSAPFLFDGVVPTPLVLWPLRLLAPLAGFEAPRLGAMGPLAGLAMSAGDVIAVWAAAHWGAAYGVRLGSLPLVAAALLWRLCLTAIYLAGVLLAIVAGGIAAALLLGCVISLNRVAGMAVLAALALAGLWFLARCCRRYFVDEPVRTVLAEFTHFDTLALDDYQPSPLRGWEILGFYGERT